MKKGLLFIPIFLMQITPSEAQSRFHPPSTKKVPVTEALHGSRLTDSYQWLEDKTQEEVKAWTNAQHQATLEFAAAEFKSVPGLRDEISRYLDRDIEGPVFLQGLRQFYYIKKKGEPQYKIYSKLDGKDILVFDPTGIDQTGLSSISFASFTKEGDRVAVGVQHKGAEISTVYIVDTHTGKIIGSPIEGLRGFSWTKDEKHAYITVGTKEMLEQQIPLKTYQHKLGAPRNQDVFLKAPADAKNFVSFSDSPYSDLTFLSEGDFYSNTLSIRKAGSKEEFRQVFSSKEYVAYPEAIGDKLYFFTNHEAPRFKIMVADKKNPGFDHWKELIPEQEDAVLEGFEVTDKYLLVRMKRDVVSRIRVYDLDGRLVRDLEAPEVGNVGSINYHRETGTFFVNLSTFTAPTKIFTVDFEKNAWTLYHQTTVPVNTDEIEARIEFYHSKDGTRVPIFVMHKKGLVPDGTNPALLYGYGGFNVSMSPSFVGLNASFINRGGVYAIACIRGGAEYGEQWHQDGMLKKKQNSFDDFIAAAEYLIAEGYTQPARLAIQGGSNGGLLVGAVSTQRPDLFKAVICAVPLLDMIRYHKFLIARYWIPEYGDPDKSADFATLLQYSPYHHIRAGVNLPASLVIAGENDTRVDPLHAKKFVAAAQNNPGQIDPVLLYMDFDSGHGSGKSTEQQIQYIEFQYTFLMNQLGMIP